MRRAKIRPSINLAASRRTVPAPSTASNTTDRSLKSPAKNVPSSPSAGTRSTRSVSAASKADQTEKKIDPKQDVAGSVDGSEGTRRLRRNSEVKTPGLKPTDEGSEKSTPNETPESSAKTDVPSADKQQNDKPEEQTTAPAASKAPPRGRRKHAPNIGNIRSRPRQTRQTQPPASEAPPPAKDAATKEKEAKQNLGCEDESVPSSVTYDIKSVSFEVAKQNLECEDESVSTEVASDGGTLPPEPPPVQRVASAVEPIPVKIHKTVIDEPQFQPDAASESSTFAVQDCQIHQDAPATTSKVSTASTKTSGSTKTTTAKNTGTPLRIIGPPEKKNPMNIYERKLRELKETLEEETPAKRRRRYVKKYVPSDRSNMTMSDLIYYNPKSNPMK